MSTDKKGFVARTLYSSVPQPVCCGRRRNPFMNAQDQAKWDAELREVVKGLHAMAAVTNPQASAFLCRAANLIEQMRTTFTHKANLLPLREACEAAKRFIESPLNTSEEIAAIKKQLEDALRGSP